MQVGGGGREFSSSHELPEIMLQGTFQMVTFLVYYKN